jgi:hypothetical protein
LEQPLTHLEPVSNDGAVDIGVTAPFVATVRLQGTSALLFHAWSNEAVAEKAAAKKGSTAKKTDNVESYIYRDADGYICLPGQYVVGSLTDPRNGAAKYRQDPRSPRKSALDLFRAGVAALTDLAPMIPANHTVPTKEWDYLDARRVTVQRAGVTRQRPAFLPGWQTTVQLAVLTPEYISPADLLDTLTKAGLLVGVGDFRPTFGRFAITSFDVGLMA